MDALRRMRQPDLFMSLKRDLAMVSTISSSFHIYSLCNPLVVLCRSLNKSLWLKNASEAPTINSRPSLISGAMWRKCSSQRSSKPPSTNVKAPWQGLRLLRLKTVEAQAEDQRKLLFTTELNLATEKATVLTLKAELEKAKAEAQGAKAEAQVVKEAA